MVTKEERPQFAAPIAQAASVTLIMSPNPDFGLKAQVVYPGSTDAVHPSCAVTPNVRVCHSKNLWQTDEMLRDLTDLVDDCVQAHADEAKHHRIFLLDAAPTHIAVAYRNWPCTGRPWVHQRFVPADFTSTGQPADRSFMRVEGWADQVRHAVRFCYKGISHGTNSTAGMDLLFALHGDLVC